MERRINTNENIRVVTSNNFLRASGLEDISLKAKKLLYLTIAQCRKEDEKFYKYKITASEFADLMGINKSHVYQESDVITDELMKGFIKYIPDGEKNYRKFQLFNVCEYNDGVLTIEISEQMTPILLHLKKDFTQPLLSDFMRMKSVFSINIWHLMQKEMKSKKTGIADIVTFQISLEELRRVTGTTEKFDRISSFKAKVLDAAIKDIRENCGVIIEYEPVKTGRTITGFKFSAKSMFYVEIPEDVKNRVTVKKAILNNE